MTARSQGNPLAAEILSVYQEANGTQRLLSMMLNSLEGQSRDPQFTAVVSSATPQFTAVVSSVTPQFTAVVSSVTPQFTDVVSPMTTQFTAVVSSVAHSSQMWSVAVRQFTVDVLVGCEVTSHR